MPPIKLCSACNTKHAAPRNRNCKQQADTTQQLASILTAVQTMSTNVSSLSERVGRLEERNEDAASEVVIASPQDRSPDRPNLLDIRQDEPLNRRVEQRLRDLNLIGADSEEDESPHTKTGMKKSGRVRTTNDLVQIDIQWPHFFVYRGANRAPAKYDELTIAEFVTGYTRITLNVDHKLAKLMLAHLNELMVDASKYSWPAVRNYHAILLQQFELGRLTWTDHEEIQALRCRYAQKPYSASAHGGNGGNAQKSTLYCYLYQEGKCQHKEEHPTAHGIVHHCCTYCLKTTGIQFRHPEYECRRKAHNSNTDEASKNNNVLKNDTVTKVP